MRVPIRCITLSYDVASKRTSKCSISKRKKGSSGNFLVEDIWNQTWKRVLGESGIIESPGL
jgi:hypothetical protein